MLLTSHYVHIITTHGQEKKSLYGGTCRVVNFYFRLCFSSCEYHVIHYRIPKRKQNS